MASPRFAENIAAARRVIALARPPAAWLVVLAVTLIGVALLNTVSPLFTGKIVDALHANSPQLAFRELTIYATAMVLFGVASLANSYASSAFRESIARNLRLMLLEKVLRARLDSATSLSLGEITTRVSGDILDLCSKLEYALFPTIRSVFDLIAAAAMMLTLDTKLALLSFALVAGAAVPMRIALPRLTAIAQEQAKLRDRLGSAVNETANLSALALLRNERARAREIGHFRALAEALRSLKLKETWIGGVASFATMLFNVMAPTVILAIGIVMAMHNQITVGTIISFIIFQGRLSAPFLGLAGLPMQLANIAVLANRLLDVADLEEETSGDVPFADGDLQMERLVIVREGRTILNDAQLSIPQGAHAAIVGPSGSGKSTLATLVSRLFDPHEGVVRIGAHDVRTFELASLREAVALVGQDPLIFDASLLENLTYTNPGAPSEVIANAIEVCALREVVARLPEGMETRLGQRGFRLSGGERQRICLARALIQGPQVLVLDEALTGVDIETEARIVGDIRRLMRDRTLVVITHRLVSVVDFDPIILVENGRVTTQGTHAYVRETSAWYRTTFETASTYLEAAI